MSHAAAFRGTGARNSRAGGLLSRGKVPTPAPARSCSPLEVPFAGGTAACAGYGKGPAAVATRARTLTRRIGSWPPLLRDVIGVAAVPCAEGEKWQGERGMAGRGEGRYINTSFCRTTKYCE